MVSLERKSVIGINPTTAGDAASVAPCPKRSAKPAEGSAALRQEQGLGFPVA
jgi:hypothetical protein